MGLVVINGLIIVLLAATGLRRMIFNAVPSQLKTAITVGIGLFIAFIGLVDAGFVPSTGAVVAARQLGDGGSVTTLPTLIFVVRLLLIGVLVARKVKGGSSSASSPPRSRGHRRGDLEHRAGSRRGTNPGGWNLTAPALPASLVACPTSA